MFEDLRFRVKDIGCGVEVKGFGVARASRSLEAPMASWSAFGV